MKKSEEGTGAASPVSPAPPPAAAAATAAPGPLAWIDDERARLEAAGLWRTLRPLDSAPGPLVRAGDQDLLLLSSNNYLGLAADPRLAEAAAAAARTLGTGSGAARLVSGSLRLHGTLERRLARLKGTEDAVLFSSGYLANLGTIAALVGRGDLIVSDQLNHASIIDGCRLSGADVEIFPHGDADACARVLAGARTERRRRVLVVTDSVFSMDGDLAPLRELAAACRRHGAVLMADEAHATGVLGGGRGAVSAAGLSQSVDVVMGTLSKALGSLGGFVAGSAALCDYLRNRARSFVFDTALPPPSLAAALCALDVLEAEPDRPARALRSARRLYDGIRAAGIDPGTPPPAAAIVPIVVGDARRAVSLSDRLRRRGVLGLAIRPPTVPPGTARIRLCPMATHTDAQIDAAVRAFAAAYHEGP